MMCGMSRPLGTAPHRVAPRALAALFIVTLAVFLLTAQRSGGHMDYWTSNYASWHLVQTGTPWIEGLTVPELDENSRRFVWVIDPAPNGHAVIGRSPGTIVVALPAYALFGSPTMTLIPAALTAALLAALSVLL